MEKTLKMSLETARQIYKVSKETQAEGNPTQRFLLENFTKEELEGKRGFTWEESFSKAGYYISAGMSGIAPINSVKTEHRNKAIFYTDKQAKSALAFAQLSHIVAVYNETSGVVTSPEGYVVMYIIRCLTNNTFEVYDCTPFDAIAPKQHFMFNTRRDALTSLEVNRDLWEQYFML